MKTKITIILCLLLIIASIGICENKKSNNMEWLVQKIQMPARKIIFSPDGNYLAVAPYSEEPISWLIERGKSGRWKEPQKKDMWFNSWLIEDGNEYAIMNIKGKAIVKMDSKGNIIDMNKEDISKIYLGDESNIKNHVSDVSIKSRDKILNCFHPDDLGTLLHKYKSKYDKFSINNALIIVNKGTIPVDIELPSKNGKENQRIKTSSISDISSDYRYLLIRHPGYGYPQVVDTIKGTYTECEMAPSYNGNIPSYQISRFSNDARYIVQIILWYNPKTDPDGDSEGSGLFVIYRSTGEYLGIVNEYDGSPIYDMHMTGDGWVAYSSYGSGLVMKKVLDDKGNVIGGPLPKTPDEIKPK